MANINSPGAPTKFTQGNVGDIYTNTNNGKKYILESIYTVKEIGDDEINYTWKPVYEYGNNGGTSSNVSVTSESIKNALGYTPANSEKVEGIQQTLEEGDVSGAITYQFTAVGDSDADVDVELSTDELVELNATITTLQSLKKANASIIAFLADLHIESWTVAKIKKAVAGYNKISSSVKTDLLVFGGDYLENSANTTKEQALGLYSDLKDVVSYCNNKAPVCVIKGNHDDNTMHTDYINGLVDAETFYSVFGNIEEDRTVRNAGNIEDCYGYYDIPNQKIRAFYLNTVDLPQELNETTNTINYKGQWDTGISIKQLQFVADNLKFDTAGWHAIVFSHHPLNYDIAIENGCGVKTDRGGSAILELLDKFNIGNASGTISVTGTNFDGTVEYDFSNNKDCKLIACVNGHTHRDSVDVYNSFFCISTRAVYGHPSYDGHISSSAYFVVDRNNYKLHLVYNGDGEENVFNYDTLTMGEVEPDEPINPDTPTLVEIESPYHWVIGEINNSTGEIQADGDSMRIIPSELIAFTKEVSIDMSGYNAMYDVYWYDLDGNYTSYGGSWTSTSVILTVPVDKAVRIKVRGVNYEVWNEGSISTFAESIKISGETGVEPIVIQDSIEFKIGAGGSSDGEAYENNARMMAVQTYGVKAYSASDYLFGKLGHPISIPSDATKIKVTCPNFIFGLIFANYENSKYVTKNDAGWQTLNGGEYSFTAGSYSHVHINFKNSSNSAIPTNTDTSGFSIEFE